MPSARSKKNDEIVIYWRPHRLWITGMVLGDKIVTVEIAPNVKAKG